MHPAQVRRIAVAVVLLVAPGGPVGAVPAGASSLRVHAPATSGPDHLRVGRDAWQFLKLTNASRERRGLAKLTLDRGGSVIAHRHSAAMAAAGDLFHTTDVSPYLDGVVWHRWGENLGSTPGGVAGLQQAFMNSNPHRHIVLGPEFRRVAIGTVRAHGELWATLFSYG